ncbi:hypothetical protein B0T20DRAFT_199037 [Sordaria brevicollis]|uniref:Uncharacterized protein n=1 Tax=Sordaria brevicollis TaxID=83679 RepID=A0AAE0UD72_SORBR|nr:hypothetical protein B0T20DRAFT_199037 [Sordaria brevicollis]
MSSKDKQPACQACGLKNYRVQNESGKKQVQNGFIRAVNTTLGNLINYAASWIPQPRASWIPGYQIAKDIANDLSALTSPISMSFTVSGTWTVGPTNSVVTITKATEKTEKTEHKPRKPRGRSRYRSRTASPAISELGKYIPPSRRTCNRRGQVFADRDKLFRHLHAYVDLNCQGTPVGEVSEINSPNSESTAVWREEVGGSI